MSKAFRHHIVVTPESRMALALPSCKSMRLKRQGPNCPNAPATKRFCAQPSMHRQSACVGTKTCTRTWTVGSLLLTASFHGNLVQQALGAYQRQHTRAGCSTDTHAYQSDRVGPIQAACVGRSECIQTATGPEACCAAVAPTTQGRGAWACVLLSRPFL